MQLKKGRDRGPVRLFLPVLPVHSTLRARCSRSVFPQADTAWELKHLSCVCHLHTRRNQSYGVACDALHSVVPAEFRAFGHLDGLMETCCLNLVSRAIGAQGLSFLQQELHLQVSVGIWGGNLVLGGEGESGGLTSRVQARCLH